VLSSPERDSVSPTPGGEEEEEDEHLILHQQSAAVPFSPHAGGATVSPPNDDDDDTAYLQGSFIIGELSVVTLTFDLVTTCGCTYVIRSPDMFKLPAFENSVVSRLRMGKP
jgi:hypothetical protein